MKYDILTVGFPLVEIMRKERGIAFDQIGDFTGPYPSGDTCILLDVAARLGKKCCFFGPVGDDVFGKVVLDRLRADGVDVSHVRLAKGYSTAAVFVRYEMDGTREYLDFINNSACSTIGPDDVNAEMVAQSKWVHFSGEIVSLCAIGDKKKAIEKMLGNVADQSKVSLDPNFTVDISEARSLFEQIVGRANLILPSEGEAKKLMDTETDEKACVQLAAQGKTIALKQGIHGCTIYRGDQSVHVPSFHVQEVDPTGCGDSFCAGFLYGLIEDWPLEEVGRFANAIGALQATAMGPMEGAKYLPEVLDFIERNGKK